MIKGYDEAVETYRQLTCEAEVRTFCDHLQKIEKPHLKDITHQIYKAAVWKFYQSAFKAAKHLEDPDLKLDESMSPEFKKDEVLKHVNSIPAAALREAWLPLAEFREALRSFESECLEVPKYAFLKPEEKLKNEANYEKAVA